MKKYSSLKKDNTKTVATRPIEEVESELVRKIRSMAINEVTASIAKKNGGYSIEVCLSYKDVPRKYILMNTNYEKGAIVIFQQIKEDVYPKSRMISL